MKNASLLLIFSLLLLKLPAQEKAETYITHYNEPNSVITHTITDSVTSTKFILDSSRIVITAIDSAGKEIWKTDAWKDNNIIEYRFKRPVIVRFYFQNNKRTKNKEVIWIVYNNSQFGIINKDNGKFTLFGQD